MRKLSGHDILHFKGLIRGLGFAGLCLSLAGCSLAKLDQTDCTDDADCAFLGGGAVCTDNGYCSAGGGSGRPAVTDPTMGFLYVGPVGDHGWTKTHDVGRKYLEQQIPGVKTTFAPSVTPTEAGAAIDEFVTKGNNIVVGTSFDFLTPVQTAALQYPDVNFLLCSGSVSGPNLGGYFGRMYQVMYQAGRLAAQLTKQKKVGLVGPVVIPESVRHINAFTLGVQSVDPDVQVMVRWAFDWFNPDEETAAANELLDGGVDVVFGHTDTTIPIEVANGRNADSEYQIYTIGYDNPDSCQFAPETCVTSAYFNWGPILTRLVKQMKEGSWDPSKLVWDQMQPDPADSTVYLQDLNPDLVPSAVRLDVEGLVDDLSMPTQEGIYLPFKGPVRDQAGNLRINENQYPTDEQLQNMCWFVKGVKNADGTDAQVPRGCVGDM